ncbi:hypothetical protein AX660_18380 [Paraglaciecola hydrolytica]|uniref:DUF3530 domain-containing protein n=1 Tax=Paraglaciecola hydrolytica TaxID=1799789 RepID=A0A135ZZG7_9ALTE|nr:hypothetical protein AX660_18380 [Paraglaciecola hydrolytica]
MFLHSITVAAAVDKQLLHDLDLRRALFSDEYSILDVAGQEMLVIINENTTAISRGTALLVTDNGMSINSQQGLAPLVKQLIDLGWVTMLIPSPSSDLFLPEEIVIEPDNANPPPLLSIKASVSQLNQQVFDEHLERVSLNMQAALEKAQEYPGFVLVIAQGTSAATLAQLYAEQKLASPDAFVVISPYWPDRKFNNQLASFLANTPMPVLDIYSKWDNSWSQASIKARKVAAIRALKLQYRQREIVGVGLVQQPATYVSKEIYGWLSHMGW